MIDLGILHSKTVKEQTIINEFDLHWVPHLSLVNNNKD